MNLHSFRAILGLFVSLFLLSACKVDVTAKVNPGSIVVSTPANQLGPVFTCSAQLSAQAGGSVTSGIEAPIAVKASGGTSPYQILNTAIAFNGETIVARTYENNGTSPVVQVDTVSVKDNLGLVTQCNFVVTVNPVNMPPSTLACNLVATPSAPSVNQSTSFVVTAQGGVAPYAFTQLSPGTNGTITSALTPTSATKASAMVTYSTAGLRSATATVTDHNGAQVVCSQSLNVAALPTVSLVASPASAVVIGNAIALTATPSGFSSTPTYTFSTSRSGVTIVPNGAVASITSSVVQSTFSVVVTATAGFQVATSTIGLSFVNPTTLPCTLSHVAGTYYQNDSIIFSVAATSGEALQITDFNTTSDVTTVSSTGSSKTLNWSLAGTKTVLIKAKSVSTGALCQAGAQMSDTVVINATPTIPALTCSGSTTYNPSYTYEWFVASATISGGQGSKWVDSIDVTQNGSTFYNYDGQWIDSTSAWLSIYNPGSYVVKFNVKDSYGHTGSCSTTQVVYY